MPIHWDKRNKRWRYQFDRIIDGRRVRAGKLLPRGWSSKEADEYDRRETAKLYSLATGQKREPLIEDAVLKWLKEAELKHRDEYTRRMALDYGIFQGVPIHRLGDVFRAIQSENIAPATKRNRCAYLLAACRFYDKKVVPDVKLPTVQNERHRYISRRDMLKIARQCHRIDVRAYIRIAFYSGMRISEIMACSVSNGRFIIEDSKNGDRRAVPIHPKIKSALRYLPPKIVQRTVAKWWMIARDAAGFQDLHFHDLRHSAASAMVNSGVDLYTIGAVLGHRDGRSTRRYAHLSTDTLEKAIRKIG